MASDRSPVTIPATPSVQGSQPTTAIGRNGKSNRNPAAVSAAAPGAPAKSSTAAAQAGATAVGATAAAGGPAAAAANAAASAAAAAAPATKVDSNESTGGAQPQALVNLLNKQLNDSGRPDEFRVAPDSGAELIQQINPATGAVVGQFSASEFPVLARSVGATGALIDGFA